MSTQIRSNTRQTLHPTTEASRLNPGGHPSASRLPLGRATALAALAITCGAVGLARGQADKMVPIDTPAQPNAIELGTGPLPGATAAESWHSQYNSVFARNVT
ncbi:MAG: hypothetical protein ACTHLZ_08230, partial [Tepidisphaeraceae bacterium]